MTFDANFSIIFYLKVATIIKDERKPLWHGWIKYLFHGKSSTQTAVRVKRKFNAGESVDV